MPAGLDVGADRIVGSTDDGTTGVANAVQAVEDSEYVAEFLGGADAQTVSGGGQRYAIGDAAPEVATMSNEQPSPLLGRSDTGADADLPEDVRADAVRAVLESIVGEGAGPLCHASTTGADAESIETATEALGYEAAPLDPALAVCYDALDAPYTGLAVVVDGSRTVATLVVEGVPVTRTELERGGDWIDSEVAAASGKEPAEIAELRSTVSLADADASGLALRYDTLLGNLALALADDAVAVDEPIPVVVAGAAAPDGIDARLADALEDENLPFEVATVDRVDAAADAAARGALVAAEAGGDVVETPEAPAVAPYAAALADEQAAESSIDPTGAGASASRDTDASGGEHRQLGADGAGPERQSAARPSAAAGSGRDDSPEDDLFQFTGEILTELEERLEQLEARVGVDDDRPLDDVVADLETDVAEVEALGEDVESTREDVEATREAVEALRERTGSLEELDETVAAVEASVSDVDERVATVDEQVATVGEQVATVGEQVSDVEGTVVEFDDALDDLEERVETLADSLAAVEADLADRENLEPAVETLEADLASLESEVERVDDDRSDVEEWVQAVDEDLEEVEDEVATIGDDVVELDGDVSDVEADVSDVEEDVAAVRATAETATERLDDLADEVGAVAAYAERVEELEAGLEDALEGSADAETVDALRERLDAIESAVEDAEAAIEETVSTGDVDAVADEQAALADDLEDLTGRLDATAERVDDLAAELPDADVAAVSADVATLDERVDDLDASLDDVASATEVAAVADDVTSLERSLEELEEIVDDLQSGVADLRRNGVERESALRDELAELQTRVERVPDDAVPEEQFASSIRRLERQVGDLEDSLEDEESAVDARAAPVAVAVLSLGLLSVGSLGGGLAYLVGEVAVAGAFVAIPLAVALVAWYVR